MLILYLVVMDYQNKFSLFTFLQGYKQKNQNPFIGINNHKLLKQSNIDWKKQIQNNHNVNTYNIIKIKVSLYPYNLFHDEACLHQSRSDETKPVLRSQVSHLRVTSLSFPGNSPPPKPSKNPPNPTKINWSSKKLSNSSSKALPLLTSIPLNSFLSFKESPSPKKSSLSCLLTLFSRKLKTKSTGPKTSFSSSPKSHLLNSKNLHNNNQKCNRWKSTGTSS